jgi:hypothetical protein
MENISFVSINNFLENIEDIAVFLSFLEKYKKTFKCDLERLNLDTCNLIDALAHENRR